MRLSERVGIWPSFFLGIILMVVGVYAANSIVNNWWPFDVTRLDLVRATALDQVDAASILEAANNEIILAFLSSILIAITGGALPIAYLLNRRFAYFVDGSHTPRFLVTLRQAMAVGIWGAFSVWLQMNRSLGIAVLLLVAGVLVLFEILMQIRTRTSTIRNGK